MPGGEDDLAAGGGLPGGGRAGGVRPDLLLDPQRNNPVDGSATAEDGGTRWWAWLLAAVAVVLVAVALVRRHRRRALGPLSPLDRSVAELEAALRRAGRPLATGTTLRQLEQRLGETPDAAAYLRALSASRYGPAPRRPTAAQRRALRRALAEGLGPAGRLRALWALPPRAR